MPYDSDSDLLQSVRDVLPQHALEIYVSHKTAHGIRIPRHNLPLNFA